MSDTAESAVEPARATRGRGLTLGIVAAALVLLLGGAAYAAYRAMSGGGAQPADALPGNALAYLRVDLDPSAAQKIAGMRLLQKFPALAEASGVTDINEDLRRRAFEEFQQKTGACASLSYDDDVASWLGDRAAIAALPPARGQSGADAAMVLQVSDQAAAETGLRVLAKCAGSEMPAHAAVGSDYLLFAATQARATAYAEAAATDPLSANPDFRDDMARLGDQGVVSGWVSVKAALKALPADTFPAVAGPQPVNAETAAAALRFGADYLELAGFATGASPAGETVDNPVVELPDTTFMAASLSGGSETVDQVWKNLAGVLASSGQSLDVLERQVQTETGLVLPADLKTVLGDNVTFAMDSEGLNFAAVAAHGDTSKLRVGARFTTDPKAFRTVLAKLTDYAASQGVPLPLTTVDGKGSVAVSTNAGYARELVVNGGLGDSYEFSNAVPDAASATSVFFVNFDAVQTQMIRLMEQAGATKEFVDNVRPLASLGISSHMLEEGVHDFRLRLTVN